MGTPGSVDIHYKTLCGNSWIGSFASLCPGGEGGYSLYSDDRDDRHIF